jgi:decaprenyl-phosphate phosphoribosyltransferase
MSIAYRLKAWILLLRPHQYTKNVLIFVPFLFGKAWEAWGSFTATFLAWCLMASAIYALNDVRDAEEDRHHPHKRHRPIAAGILSPTTGYLTALALSLAAILIAFFVNLLTLSLLLLYAINNLLYTFYLKRIQLLDVFSIAAGFVLRVYGGAAAGGIPVSPYLFMTVFFLSLYLAFGKRRHELLLTEKKEPDFRQVLRRYSVYYLDQLMVISATMTLVVYVQYLLEGHYRWLLWTLPLVVLGLFRYYHLTHNLLAGEPSRDLFADPFLLVVGALYGVFVGLELMGL